MMKDYLKQLKHLVEPQDEADALAAMEGCPVQVIEKVED